MKFLLVFTSIIFLFASSSKAQSDGCSKGYTSLVFEEKTGDILFEKRSDEIVYPASLVKLMTLYLTFEAIENNKLTPEKSLIVSERGEEISKVNKSNTMRLRVGDKITVREAIHGVIVKSFNEAAVTLAEAVSEDEWDFARKMNEKAQKLGMINSSFRNSSGLHEEGQYTTAYDLALLTAAIKKDFPEYYHIFSLKEFSFNGTKYKTHNHVLVDYKGAEGMKTGFTNASGFNLVSAAKRGENRIISVLLGCSTFKQRDKFTKELFDESFNRLEKHQKNEWEAKLGKAFDYAKESEKEFGEYDEKVNLGD